MTQQHADLDLEELPEQIRWLVTSIGVLPTLKLLRGLGGTRIRVPKDGSNSPLLVELIGQANAAKVGEILAGYEYIWLPMPGRIEQQLRNADIKRKRPTSTLKELALEHQLTVRQVLNILGDSAPETGSDQGDLFSPVRRKAP